MAVVREDRPAGGRTLSVLLLCDDKPQHAGTVLAHIDALRRYSRHRVRSFNPTGMTHPWYLNLDEFDAVVIHYSLLCSSNWYLHRSFREQIARFRGLKVQFIQDEYRWIDEITSVVREMGVHFLFTCIPEPEAEKVYGGRLPGVIRVPTLTGYVPDALLGARSRPVTERPIDIGYRAREIPFWLGTFAREKYLIAKGVLERAEKHRLRCDISWREAERLYGQRWIDFLASCRATLGTGSGASIADFDGSIQQTVDAYLAQHPHASYEEVHEHVLRPFDGNLKLDVISPRIFEAIALHTALVLFPSEYSGVIRPYEHYIPLEKDFSNFDDVVRMLRDDELVTKMTARAFDDVVAPGRYSYRQFAREFDRVLDRHAARGWHIPLSFEAARTVRRVHQVQVKASKRAAAAVKLATAKGSVVLPPSARRFLQSPGTNTVKGYLALKATLRAPERRALVARWLLSRRLRRHVSMDVMFDDLLKLDVLEQAQESRLAAGVIFKPWPHIAGNGAIEMTTLLTESSVPEAIDAKSVLEAVEEGGVTSMVWNHTAIARCVWLPVTPRRWVMLHLGSEGRHPFAVVTHLLSEDRPMAVRLLAPVLGATLKPQHAPARARVARVKRYPALRRFLRAPGTYSIRLLLVIQRVAARPMSRRLLWQYATDPRLRSATSVDGVLEDLLKADLLRTAWARPNGFIVELAGTNDLAHRTYVSRAHGADRRPADGANPASADLCWDHTAVGNSITVRMPFGTRTTVYLGADGRYTFSALSAIASLAPAIVAAVLPEGPELAESAPAAELETAIP